MTSSDYSSSYIKWQNCIPLLCWPVWQEEALPHQNTGVEFDWSQRLWLWIQRSLMGPGWDSYILHDNDFHLCCLWLVLKYLGPFYLDNYACFSDAAKLRRNSDLFHSSFQLEQFRLISREILSQASLHCGRGSLFLSYWVLFLLFKSVGSGAIFSKHLDKTWGVNAFLANPEVWILRSVSPFMEARELLLSNNTVRLIYVTQGSEALTSSGSLSMVVNASIPLRGQFGLKIWWGQDVCLLNTQWQ